MKKFLKEYPFISSLIITGIMVVLTFAVSKFAGDRLFAGDTVLASAETDADEGLAVLPERHEDVQETEKISSVMESVEEESTAEESMPEESVPGENAETTEVQIREQDEADAAGTEAGQEAAPADDIPEPADEEASETPEEEHPVGVTEYIYYEPKEVDSRYYDDPGKLPLTTNYPYSTVEKDFFDDAAFIGDSRMMGLFDYAGFDNADFFCDNGFCVYNWQKKGEVTFQNERSKVNLMDALAEKQYQKVYLMIGLNDCGYGNSDTFKQGLEEMIRAIMERQPDAVIYLMANMYIAREKEDDIFNNTDINSKNVRIAECADGERLFYLDYNDLYLDESGYLKSELTFDGAHLYGKEYAPWIDFLMSHAVVKGDEILHDRESRDQDQ